MIILLSVRDTQQQEEESLRRRAATTDAVINARVSFIATNKSLHPFKEQITFFLTKFVDNFLLKLKFLHRIQFLILPWGPRLGFV